MSFNGGNCQANPNICLLCSEDIFRDADAVGYSNTFRLGVNQENPTNQGGGIMVDFFWN